MSVRSLSSFSGMDHSIISHSESWSFEPGVICMTGSKEVERFMLQEELSFTATQKLKKNAKQKGSLTQND